MPGEVRDAGLWSRYVAYLKVALAFLRKRQQGRPIPTVVKERVRRRDASTVDVTFEEEPGVLGLVFPLFAASQELKQFQDLRRYIEGSPLGNRVFVDAGKKPIRDPVSQHHRLMNLYITPLLTRYIGPELLLDFEEGRARALYADLEASLECTEAVYSVVAPLQDFEGPEEEIWLDRTMLLRKLSEEEVEHFWRLVDETEALSMEFCLATRLVTERNAPTDLTEVVARLVRVLTALRLLKSGQVGIPVVIERLRQPVFGFYGSTVGTSVAPAAPGPGYTLLLEETEALIATYEALADAASAKDLAVALRRFNYAYERTRPDDRLIDYWIALEALFLPGISDELSFRAPLRIAYYVGTSPNEREEVYDKMRLSYKTRSQVVHGERPKADVRQVASDTEEILRRALGAEVKNPGSLDVKRLDAAIARGESPTTVRNAK